MSCVEVEPPAGCWAERPVGSGKQELRRRDWEGPGDWGIVDMQVVAGPRVWTSNPGSTEQQKQRARLRSALQSNSS